MTLPKWIDERRNTIKFDAVHGARNGDTNLIIRKRKRGDSSINSALRVKKSISNNSMEPIEVLPENATIRDVNSNTCTNISVSFNLLLKASKEIGEVHFLAPPQKTFTPIPILKKNLRHARTLPLLPLKSCSSNVCSLSGEKLISCSPDKPKLLNDNICSLASSPSSTTLDAISGEKRFIFTVKDVRAVFSASLCSESPFVRYLDKFLPCRIFGKGRLGVDGVNDFICKKTKRNWTVIPLRVSFASSSESDIVEYKRFFNNYEMKNRLAMFSASKLTKLFFITPKFQKSVLCLPQGVSKIDSSYVIVVTKEC